MHINIVRQLSTALPPFFSSLLREVSFLLYFAFFCYFSFLSTTVPRGAQVFPQVFRRSSPMPGHKGLEVFPEVFPGIKRLTRSMVNYQLSVVKNIAVFSKNEPDFLNGYRLCSYQTTCSTERLPVCASKNPKQSVAPQFTSRDIQRDGKGNTFSCDIQANLQKCYYSVFIRAVEVYCRCAAACGRCARFFGRGGRWRCVPRRSGQEDFRPSDGDFFSVFERRFGKIRKSDKNFVGLFFSFNFCKKR